MAATTATSTTVINNSYSAGYTSGTGGTLTDAFQDNPQYPKSFGTAAGQIDTAWSGSGTLSTGTTTFQVSALVGPGSLTSAFARVDKIWIHNQATSESGTNTLVFAPAASSPWLTPFVSGGSSTTAGVTIRPGGAICLISGLATGYVVTATSADKCTLTSVGSVPYTISFEGRSV